MVERFTRSARAVVGRAGDHAIRRGDRRIGSDHLLLALLDDPALASAVGVDAAAACSAADALDRAALRTVGVDVENAPAEAPAALRRPPRMPFTVGAKRVLQRTVRHAGAEQARSLDERHLMLAVLDEHAPGPAAALLRELRVDTAAVRARLASPV